MVSICSKLASFIPLFNKTKVSRFVIGAGGLVTYWFAGSAAAVFAMLAGYVCKKSLSRPLHQKVVPIMRDIRAFGDSNRAVSCLKLDSSTYLFEPEGQAADIKNQGNSCAFSTVLWNLANMREFLGELPLAILKRLDQLTPLEGSSVDIAALNQLLAKREPISLKDFNSLRRALLNLEGFFADQNTKELISLLQLHQLIQDFQATKQMPGSRVNVLRDIISRVNPSFEGTGVRMGDAHEIFLNLTELVFRNSCFRQQFHFVNPFGRPSHEPNWGHVELPLEKGISLADTLIEYLNSCEGQFDTAPPLMAISLKRNGFTYVEGKTDQWVPTVTKLFDPIIPNDAFHLTSDYFRDKRGARYHLIGVSRRLEDRAHYDAIWKRPDGQWYYGDDLDKVSRAKPPANPSGKASQVASQGYLFIYRKMQ